MAAKAHVPTDQTRANVKTMAGYMIPQKDIARLVGIDDKTLRKYYADELADGVATSNLNLGRSLYMLATGAPAEYDPRTGQLLRAELPRDRSVAIFLGKARLGLRDTQVVEHTGKGGGPIQTTAWDLSALNDEEFGLLEALVEKAAARKAG